ncbi:MAG: TolC family outer membrane protein [Betaproteobacteria bacterium]
MKRFKPLALAVFFATAFSAPLHAQNLSQLYDAAKNYDATYQAVRAQYAAAQAKLDQAKATFMPTVALQTSATRTNTENLTTNNLSQTGIDPSILSNKPYLYQTSTASDANGLITDKKIGATIQQNIYTPANSIAIDQAEKSLQSAKTSMQSTEQDLMVKVGQAYFDVLSAVESLRFAQTQKIAVAEQLASAKRNFEVGTATITDSKEAQARYDLIIAQEISAENDLIIKSSLLDQTVGVKKSAPKPLKPKVKLPDLFGTEDYWVNLAMDSSLQIQLKRYDLEIANLEINRAKTGHLPTIVMNGGYTKNQPNGQTITASNLTGSYSSPDAPYQPNQNIAGANPRNVANTPTTTLIPGTNTSYFVGATLNMPLFSGFSVQNRIKETLALVDKARADLDSAQRTVTQTVRANFYNLKSVLGQVRAFEAAEESSQSALDANKLGYSVGVRINIDVLNSQSQLFETKAKLAKARYDVLVGDLKLKQSTGTLKEDDVNNINKLLEN